MENLKRPGAVRFAILMNRPCICQFCCISASLHASPGIPLTPGGFDSNSALGRTGLRQRDFPGDAMMLQGAKGTPKFPCPRAIFAIHSREMGE
jgi:hypothetical protein